MIPVFRLTRVIRAAEAVAEAAEEVEAVADAAVPVVVAAAIIFGKKGE